MTDKQTINIDITRLSNLAHTGVRRAVLFMGLGLNAAYREDFVDYELRKIPFDPGQTSLPIEFFPSNLPAERVKKFKEEFATWITGNVYASYSSTTHYFWIKFIVTRFLY